MVIKLYKLVVAVMIFLILLICVFMVIVVFHRPYAYTPDYLGELVRASAVIMVILAVIYITFTRDFIGYVLDVSTITVIILHYVYVFSIPRITSVILLPLFNLIKGVSIDGREYGLLSLDFAQIALVIILIRHRNYIVNKLKILRH